jgi:hypothetical protein
MTPPWPAVGSVTVLAVYFAVAMEWLFFVTHPTLSASFGTADRVGTLLVTPLPLALAALGPVVVLRFAAAAVRHPRAGAVAAAVGWLLPAAVLAASAFLLVDNFTYTLFAAGVETTTSRGGRGAYAALLALFLAAAFRVLRRAARDGVLRHRRAVAAAAATLVLASALVGAGRWAAASRAPDRALATAARSGRLPNILVVSSDGIDANRTSPYGARRPTTPFLGALARRALRCENAFPNATVTAASVTSLLTGRSPARTGVLYQGHFLAGADAYRHLPAILRRLGYAAIAVGPMVADPVERNLRDAFDVANRRRRTVLEDAPAADPVRIAFSSELYFLEHVGRRLGARLEHAGGRRTIVNELREVEKVAGESDEDRVTQLLDFVARSSRPVFGQLHLMGTHGPYDPRHRVFSAYCAPKGVRWEDLRDDALVDFDRLLARIVERLIELGKWDETVLVVTSDHGHAFGNARIPLLFFFPGGEYAGTLRENAQLVDVAPTLLDYVGAPVPEWMDGRSLLTPPPADRPIVTVVVDRMPPRPGGIEALALTVCDRVIELHLRSGRMGTRFHAGHTAPCPASVVPDESAARAILDAYLPGPAAGGTRAERLPGREPVG